MKKEKIKFKYKFLSLNFIKGGMFDFNNYTVSCILDIIRVLDSYRKYNWNDIMYNKKFHYHKVDEKKIEGKKECFGFKQTNIEIFIMKINHIERLLFNKIKNICYPIGYDKYHFLYSKHTNVNNINVNSLKYYLYYELRNLIGNKKTTEIINSLIKNKISFQDKDELNKQINIILEKIYKQFPNKYNKIKKEINRIIKNHF